MPLIELSAMVGRQRVAWRYDPVLLTQTYTVTRHLETFARMARVLAPHVDRCIFSFVEMYRKLQVNMPELIPLSTQDMDTLARGLGEIARAHGMPIQTCGTNGDFTRYASRPRAASRWTSWAGPTASHSGTASTGGRGRAATA